MSILKNPMVLMMIMGVGGMYMMPKMMDGLDPEQKELMQKQMAMQQDPSKVSRCEEGGGGGSFGLSVYFLSRVDSGSNVSIFLFRLNYCTGINVLDYGGKIDKMLTQMFQDMTGTGEEPAAPQIEKKASSKAGGKTVRRGKYD